MKPLSPKDLKAVAGDQLPPFVIEAANNLLKKGAAGGYPITIKQCSLVNEINRLRPPGAAGRKPPFDNGWLDIEPAFRRQGWSVTYDKPGFNESYEPTFEFRPKRNA